MAADTMTGPYPYLLSSFLPLPPLPPTPTLLPQHFYTTLPHTPHTCHTTTPTSHHLPPPFSPTPPPPPHAFHLPFPIPFLFGIAFLFLLVVCRWGLRGHLGGLSDWCFVGGGGVPVTPFPTLTLTPAPVTPFCLFKASPRPHSFALFPHALFGQDPHPQFHSSVHLCAISLHDNGLVTGRRGVVGRTWSLWFQLFLPLFVHFSVTNPLKCMALR